MWLPATAILLRLSALKEIGPLDQRFFAYYEDDELGARFAAAGWVSRVAFEVAVKHSMPRAETDRPPYYFYLIQRNYLIFWFENTPPAYRRLLWLRLIDQAIFEINKLKRKGFSEHANAAALGLLDFLSKTYGAPNLARRVPAWIKLAIRIVEPLQDGALRRVLEADPGQARQRST
jgi:GT2 family glycosyltransferase